MKSKLSYSTILRWTILLTTAVLIVICISLFVSQFQQYRNIQNRIQNIYSSLNSKKTNFNALLTNYNETENYFRLFALDFNDSNYKKYENGLLVLKTQIDSVLRQETGFDDIDFKIAQRKIIAEEFINIKRNIDTIIKSNHAFLLQHSDKPVLTQKTISITPIRKDTLEKSNNIQNDSAKNQIVIKKKSLFKRIFDTKNDTISYEQVNQSAREKEEIIVSYEKVLNNYYKSEHKRLTDFKTLYDLSHQKEKTLLTTNFEVLNDLNQMISKIEKNNLASLNQYTNHEISSIIDKNDTVLKKMVVCGVILLILILLLIYYQNFSFFYQKRLINEQAYANHLAEEKTNILAEISHEIRTPINALLSTIDVFQQNVVFENQEDESIFNSAINQIQATSHTISHILDINKLENTENPASNYNTYFNLQQVIQDVFFLLKDQASIKGLRLVCENNINHLICTDEFKLKQILTNLLSNAIKYSAKGKITCTSTLINENTLHIIIADEGMGIAPDDLKNVFKKYFTVNPNSEKTQGIGLGLYLVKRLVENLEGTIELKSEVNRGSHFSIILPVKKGLKLQKSNDNQKSKIPKDFNWLIVDDNPINIFYTTNILNKPHHTYAAKNGFEALEIMKNHKIDVVITDLNMPQMNGLELVKAIRTDLHLKHQVFFIGTSSDADQLVEVNAAKDHKLDAILTKPFNKNDIERILSTIILKNQATNDAKQ